MCVSECCVCASERMSSVVCLYGQNNLGRQMYGQEESVHGVVAFYQGAQGARSGTGSYSRKASTPV